MNGSILDRVSPKWLSDLFCYLPQQAWLADELLTNQLSFSLRDCAHRFGQPEEMLECVRSCWRSTAYVHGVTQQGAITVTTMTSEYDTNSSIHGAIISALPNLEFTGSLADGFYAYWPFADTPGLYTLPISRTENAWIDLMPNSNSTSCLAVMSFRCFEYYYSDRRGTIARTCPGRHQTSSRDQHTSGCDTCTHEGQNDPGLPGNLNGIGHQRSLFPEITQIRGRGCGEADVEGTARKTRRQTKATFLRTHIQLNPSTPAEISGNRDTLGQIRLREGDGLFMGELGTIEIIRSNGRDIQLATLKSHELGRLRSALERPSVHRERLDPHVNSGNIVELCITDY